MRLQDRDNYEVTVSLWHDFTVFVQATSEEEALQIAERRFEGHRILSAVKYNWWEINAL